MDDDLEGNIKRAMPGALKMSLYAAKKQSFEVLKYTMEGMDSICNNAAMLKDFDDQDHLSALEETTKEFAVLEAQIARYKQTLEKMEALIESGEIDPAKIEKMIDDSLVEPQLNASKHEFFKRFCDRAGIELEQDGDEEVVFQQSESSRSTVCPVTQLEMKKPLRKYVLLTLVHGYITTAYALRDGTNDMSGVVAQCAKNSPSCNHTYSEEGIRSHLQRSKKCPVAGCPQKLSFSNLERDVEMEVLIARRKNGSQQQRTHLASVQRYSDNEEDEEEYVVE